MYNKFIATTISEFLTDQKQINESRLTIPKTSLNGTFYHGSTLRDDDYVIEHFNFGNSDYDAIWLADDEAVADTFSTWHSSDTNDVRVVYRTNLKINNIADISYELSQRLVEDWALYDFRDSIEPLKKKNFNGWITTGAIDFIKYNDIAIFYPDKIQILDAKLFINGDWTDYMSIDDANDMLSKIRNLD